MFSVTGIKLNGVHIRKWSRLMPEGIFCNFFFRVFILIVMALSENEIIFGAQELSIR